MKKKVLSILASLMLVAFAFTGCGGAAQQSASTAAATGGQQTAATTGEAAKDEKVTLRFTTWDTASMLDSYKKVISSFNQKYPNIEIQVESVPDSYDQKIFTSIAAGNAPDTFLWWNYPQLVSSNAVQPLDDLIGSAGIDLTKYYPTVLDTVKVDGKLYAIPNAPCPRAMYYYKDIFDKAGVAYPDSNWTYDDFLSIAQKLTGNGVYGFVIESKNTYTLQQFIWTFGGQVISKDGKTLEGYMNSPKTAEALQWYADLVNKYKVAPSPSSTNSMGGGTEMFKTGKLAMFESGPWPIADFKAMKDFKVGTVTMPKKDGKVVGIIHGNGFVVSRATKHLDEAVKFISFMGGYEGQKEFAKMGYALPGMPEVADELKTAEDPLLKAFLEMGQNATEVPGFMTTENWSKIDEKFSTAMEATVLNKMTAQDALNEAVKEAQDAVKLGK